MTDFHELARRLPMAGSDDEKKGGKLSSAEMCEGVEKDNPRESESKLTEGSMESEAKPEGQGTSSARVTGESDINSGDEKLQSKSKKRVPALSSSGSETELVEEKSDDETGLRTPRKSTRGKSARGKSIPGKGTPGKGTPGKGTPGKGTTGKSTPGKSTPGKRHAGKGKDKRRVMQQEESSSEDEPERKRRKYMQRLDRKNRKQTSRNPKPRRQCIYCPRMVVDLAFHCRKIHKTMCDQLEKRRQGGDKCPLCDRYYIKIGSHVQNLHKIGVKSTQYKECMQKVYEAQVEAARAVPSAKKTPSKMTPSKQSHSKPIRHSETTGRRSPKKTRSKKLHSSKMGRHFEATSRQGTSRRLAFAAPAATSTPTPESASPHSSRQSSESDGQLPAHAVTLLASFQQHLEGFDGGLRSAPVASQHRNQIEMMWWEISSSYRLKDIMNRKKIKNWLAQRRDADSTPGTLLSYLASLRMWCEFLTKSAGSDVKDVLSSIKSWNNSLQKSRKERATEKMVETQTITPEEVTTLEASDLFRRADDINLQLLEDRYEGFRDASELLDWIAVTIFRLGIQSGLRLGVFAGLRLERLRAAEATETGEFIIPIAKHKTGYKGPVILVLTAEMRRTLLAFSAHRPQTDNEELFVRMSGSSFSASRLSDLLSDRLQPLLGRRVPGTLIRKSVASEMWKKHPESRGELARSMGHSEQTAGSYYLMPLAKQSSSNVSKKIRGIFAAGKSKRKPPAATASKPESDTESQQSEMPSEISHTETEVTRQSYTEEPPVIQPPGSFVERASPPSMSGHSESSVVQGGRRSFTPLETRTLLQLCEDRIRTRLPLISTEIVERLGDDPEAAEVLCGKSTKQLADRVRSEIRKLKKQDKD